MEINIREFSVTNTFAYAYVCLKRYVFDSIGPFQSVLEVKFGEEYFCSYFFIELQDNFP